MSDKELIHKLKGINKMCGGRLCGRDCEFWVRGNGCQIRQLIIKLAETFPEFWDMEEIERIINQ